MLFDAARYEKVRQAGSPEEQCHALQSCGYATDPNYAAKLISIIESNRLTVYDKRGENDEMTSEEKEAFAALQKTVQLQTERIVKLEANA